MKKTLSILLSFMLIFMAIGPLPPVFAASSITGSTAGEGTNGRGTITVSGARSGAPLMLVPKEGGSNMNGNATAAGTYTFSGVEPGIYTVSETAADGTVSNSNEAKVIPSAVKVASPDQSGRIVVSDAKPTAKLTIRHDRIGFTSPPTEANQEGIGIFNVGYQDEQVSPGKNYRVVQTINGVTSAESNSIDIAPERVRLNVTIQGAGINNNGGAIEVTDTRKGNRLFLYKVASGTEPTIRTVEAEDTFTFTGLSAGEYYVVQEEHGAASPESNYVRIIDEMAPTIELVGPATDRVSMPKNNDAWEYPVSISDVTASDNISNPTITYTISPNQKMNTPGVYRITYTATDDAGNTASVTKTVTIAPPTLDIDENKIIHTFIPGETKPGRNVGDIFVNNVMAEATIRVYQDPGGKPIKTITRANDATFGEFKVTDIPVGKTYYITQTVNGIESETSIRVDIRDTTKPTIELNGDKEVQFVRGDTYIEYGATATDNVDPTAELSAKIVTNSSAVNMNVPGKYIVTYNVTDEAGNVADEVTRTVVVSPHAVIAIGSNADVGEVGVKNAFPGTVLKLYSVTDSINPVAVSPTLAVDATTYVFKNPTLLDGTIPNADMKIPPGSYYVIQEFTIADGILESMRSNIVDVVDTNRPHITITGSENLFFTWDVSKDQYTYDKDNDIAQFTDPGATATDYLDDPKELTKKIKRKIMFGNELICDENILDNPLCKEPLEIEVPGIYKIIYSVTTERGAKADEKQRTVTVAPPKVGKLEAEAGKSTIEVDEVFKNTKTVTMVNLYNTYGQLLESKEPASDATAIFKEVPAGLGYYVTQTVNGIESAPSDPVNVNLYGDAEDPALITSFEFASIRAYGTIDHNTEKIEVVVPKSTDVSKLKAKFTATGTVKVGTTEQINGNTPQNFTNSVRYTVASKDGKQTKDYEVTVTKSTFETTTWSTTVSKSVSFSAIGSTFALTQADKSLALKQGVSFIGRDRAIHIPASNVSETDMSALTVKIPTAVTNASDPAWRTSIQHPTEIEWGNFKGPFMQPIEMEMPNPNGKQFAKLVRQNDQLFAIIQPSEMQGSNIIGLVTEPGTYALIDDIAQPTIQESTSSGNTTYQLSTGVAGGQIYYTTNSKHVAFDRSARKATLTSYSLDSVPSNLSDWNVYKSGERISASTGELYAFVMKDRMISPLAHAEAIPQVEWKPNVPVYPTYKVLNITFNAKVDPKALYSGTIYVVDNTTGKRVGTTLELSPDGKTIFVTPENTYTAGNQYTLHIDRQFKGNTKNNEFLKQPLTQTFKVK